MEGFASPRQQRSGGSDKNSTPFRTDIYTVHLPDIALLQLMALGHNGVTPSQCVLLLSTATRIAIPEREAIAL